MNFDPSTAQPDEPKKAAAGKFDPATAKPEPPHMSWGEVGSKALANLPGSALGVVESTVQPLLHPVQTVETLGNTAIGEGELLAGQKGGDVPYAKGLNDYFVGRYGSIEGFKKAVAEDPAGVVADLSTLATGGGEAPARLPGIVGDVGRATADVGRAANPINMVGKVAAKVAKPAGKLTADVVGSLGTHTGGTALEHAFTAGRSGGQAAQSFIDHMRGNAPVDEIVNSAKRAVAEMRADRGKAYRSGMANVAQDKTVLDFKDIDQHLARTSSVKKFKGKDISPATADVRGQIEEVINDWKGESPAEYHTVEGFDALKQRLGDIKDSLPYHTPQRLIAEQAYNAVRESITKQAPEYARVMRDYEQASKELDEMQKTLSLNPKASVDTAARKLLSIMRNNVNTNFGRRVELGQKLAEHGAPELPYQLAGETLSPHFPTSGFGRLEGGLGGLAAWLFHNPALLAMLPMMSPRLMGEAALKAGQASRYASPVGRAVSKVSPYGYALGRSTNPPPQ
jgi:hypothetical protein